ncbi:MAG: hexose kinase [Anaerolineae bacterium]|nr:hexose kinase [Thermoflexales bacterium]MDW8407791.1 hexose kinase [Anaerolineae bacterium]
MFLVIGLNPTLDVVMRMRAPAFGQLNIADQSAAFPSGKGMNLARYLAQLGNDTVLLGFIGRDEAHHFIATLESSGARQDFVILDAPTRINVKVIDSDTGEDTEFNMRGAPVSAEQVAAVEAKLEAMLPHAQAVALTGSLPPGAPASLYARWIRRCKQVGVPVALDASGERLRLGLAEHPWLIKVNWFELSQQAGERSVSEEHALSILREWIAHGAQFAVVTRADRVILAAPAGIWQATTPRLVAQNPVGAGDALMAGLLSGWGRGLPPAELLRQACAVAVASVLSMDPGRFAPSDREAVLPQIAVTPVEDQSA